MATNWTICWTSHRNVGVNVGVGLMQARKLLSFNEKVWEFESLRPATDLGNQTIFPFGVPVP